MQTKEKGVQAVKKERAKNENCNWNPFQSVPSLYFVCVIYTFIECSEWLF